jgi:hypothetical protein
MVMEVAAYAGQMMTYRHTDISQVFAVSDTR